MSQTDSDILADYVDRSQLAEKLNCSTRTISRYMAEPDGLPYVRVGGRTLFRLETVRRWLERREHYPNPTRRS